MGNVQSSKLNPVASASSKLVDSQAVTHLSFQEEGYFAKIYKGEFGPGRQKVTIKVPRVAEVIRKDRKQVKLHVDEVKKLLPVIRRPRGDHVVRTMGVAYDDFRKEVWIIREYVDGTDLETLAKNPSLCPALRSPEKRIKLALGLVKGVSHLHSLRSPVVHGDLKLSDWLVDAHTLVPRLANFGLWDFKEFFLRHASTAEHSSRGGGSGQQHAFFLNPSQAPEVLLGSEPRPTLFSDRWGLGAVLMQWLAEQPVWDLSELCQRYRLRSDRQLSALRNAMDNEEDPTIVQHIDEDLAFVRECFNYQATSRPAAREVEHKLLQWSQTPTWTNVAYHKYYS